MKEWHVRRRPLGRQGNLIRLRGCLVFWVQSFATLNPETLNP